MFYLVRRGFELGLFVSFSLLGILGCTSEIQTQQPVEGRATEGIIGGFPARDARFDAIGALARFDSAFCSGVLIAPDVVLTAAHCVRDRLFGGEEFRIGFDSTSPTRAIPITGGLTEDEVVGGFLDAGSDVAVVFLAESVDNTEPLVVGNLNDEDLGKTFVGVGYGVRNNEEDFGQRYLGAMDMRGIGGNHAINVWGAFDIFLEEFLKLNVPIPVEDLFSASGLLPEYQASFGNASMNAQACFGDSGGPIVAMRDGQLTVFGVCLGGGLRTTDLACNWGVVSGVFGAAGSVVNEFIDRALGCRDIPESGVCDDLETLVSCAPSEEGGWVPVDTDCSMLGQICGENEDGEPGCIVDPCADIAPNGECQGTVAMRCSSQNEGPRRVLATDCAILGSSCGVDKAGVLACINPS